MEFTYTYRHCPEPTPEPRAARVSVYAISITAYYLRNTGLLCTINYINTKEETNRPTNHGKPQTTPVSMTEFQILSTKPVPGEIVQIINPLYFVITL